MIAELITIGDELITGHTINSNAAWLARELLSIGISADFHTTVGDNVNSMENAFSIALRRADLIICTGGLGPTDDDQTKKAIVKVFKRKLVYHEDVLEDIRTRYAARGIEMPEINQNQALLPQDAKFLKNRLGSAVGILIEENDKTFLALPGVPAEMMAIFTEEFAPSLKSRTGTSVTISRLIRTSGLVESKLAEMIATEIPLPEDVKLAYLPHTYGVDVRLMCTEKSARLAEELIEQPQGWLKRKLGEFVYGEDADTLESVVGDLLRQKGAKLSLAESCTAGMVAARLANIPGSSDYLERGYVTYSNTAKIEELNVSEGTLEKHGAVSEETAREMAQGALLNANTDYAVSVTGIAGPDGGTADKPVGLIWIAIAVRSDDGEPKITARKFLFGNDRAVNRERATGAALNLLRLALLDS